MMKATIAQRNAGRESNGRGFPADDLSGDVVVFSIGSVSLPAVLFHSRRDFWSSNLSLPDE